MSTWKQYKSAHETIIDINEMIWEGLVNRWRTQHITLKKLTFVERRWHRMGRQLFGRKQWQRGNSSRRWRRHRSILYTAGRLMVALDTLMDTHYDREMLWVPWWALTLRLICALGTSMGTDTTDWEVLWGPRWTWTLQLTGALGTSMDMDTTGGRRSRHLDGRGHYSWQAL